MKTLLQALIVLSIILVCSMQAFAQGVVVSEDENATADPSALLDVQSGDKGFLPPRMTTAEWNAIADPANGLVVYDTVENKLVLYNGTEWVELSAAGSLWTADGEDIYRIAGNVGIGEEVPVGKLHVSSPGEWAGIMFTGTGLNDLSTDISGYTGTGSTDYAIRIQNAGPDPNVIEISDDGGSTWSAPMDIVPDIDMGFGVTANFGNTYGHIFGDRWDWTVNESFSDVLVVSDDMVGIGTQTPHAELEVAGDIHVSGGDRSIFNRSDQALAFGTNNTERMRIASSGDVGIGTSNPVHPLHVETAASASPSRAIFGLANAGSGLTYGVHGESSSPEGTGVYGLATAGSGTTYGVHGQNSSTDGTGVFGEANAVDGFLTYGVHGSSISGIGVFGEATGAFGETIGVHGESSSTEGTGIYGLANAGSGFTVGVHGKSSSTDGVGVYGEATAGSGFTSGVYAVNSSTEGDGIFARATASSGVTYGVRTWNSSTSGYGVYSLASASSGTTYGVYGSVSSPDGYAGYFTGPAGSRNYFARPVGIGTLDPDASAALDVTSTTKGFLPPRLTETQRDVISSPATGLIIYQTDGTVGLYQYDGAAWAAIGPTTYSVGDFAQGGIVFWVDETGQHGLVAAKEDQGIEVDWNAGTFGSDTQAKGDGLFAGEANTSIIIAALIAIGDNGFPYAARICNELIVTEGGTPYGDWYLPSKEELNLMYQNKAIIDATAGANGGSSFASDYYWSSTENTTDHAWTQNFTNGNQLSDIVSNQNRVRAVRAF